MKIDPIVLSKQNLLLQLNKNNLKSLQSKFQTTLIGLSSLVKIQPNNSIKSKPSQNR
jgi:hypothetical protein